MTMIGADPCRIFEQEGCSGPRGPAPGSWILASRPPRREWHAASPARRPSGRPFRPHLRDSFAQAMIDGRDVKRRRQRRAARPFRCEQHQSDRIGTAGNAKKNAARGLPRTEHICNVSAENRACMGARNFLAPVRASTRETSMQGVRQESVSIGGRPQHCARLASRSAPALTMAGAFGYFRSISP